MDQIQSAVSPLSREKSLLFNWGGYLSVERQVFSFTISPQKKNFLKLKSLKKKKKKNGDGSNTVGSVSSVKREKSPIQLGRLPKCRKVSTHFQCFPLHFFFILLLLLFFFFLNYN